ncbi:MAG: prepilin-type N-terminal cleavage/methylation domain-containing protein [Phycisphaeraceae bacterium]|nr:MAG: prepilin-type N-terminal cleavage/methylation domain-containing protein [Phycisphaeraceae bacterium]
MSSGCRRAFTLIELLVVIGVIALLIGLLLPALGKARDSGYQTRCMTNMRECARSALFYANDAKDQFWIMAPRDVRGYRTTAGWEGGNAWWARRENPENRNNRAMDLPGWLFDYVGNAHQVVSCPKNKRNSSTYANQRFGMFGSEWGVLFDYTVPNDIEGLKTGSGIRAAYLPPIVNTGGIRLQTTLVDRLIPLPGLPIFVEESLPWYNERVQDGLFGNLDQVTLRHDKGGMVAYHDWSVGLFKAPAGGFENVEEANSDFVANDLYVNVKGSNAEWYKLYREGRTKWGWINNPTLNQ